jgi:polyisoprenoid-binding protein YceI
MKLQTWASVIVVLTWLVGDDPLCAVEAPPSASADYAINRSYSTIGFSIYKWIVMKEEGVFREFHGSVHYDPAKPERSHIVITAQAASLPRVTPDATRCCGPTTFSMPRNTPRCISRVRQLR